MEIIILGAIVVMIFGLCIKAALDEGGNKWKK